MPEDDNPQSYPAAETTGGNPNAPMPNQDDIQADSSTVEREPDNSETATSEQAIEGSDVQSDGEPFHKHPRFQELIQQNKELARREEESRRLAQMTIERFQPQTPQAAPEKDPWEGYVNHPDPQTAQFWQTQRQLFQREAEKMADTKLSQVMEAVNAGRNELAQIKVAEFRRQNPEIKPGSQEEASIAGYVQQGYDLETAKSIVMFPKVQARLSELEKKQSAVPKKAAANVASTSGIPAGAGLPAQKGDWRETASSVIDKGGSAVDAFNAVFGRKR